MYIFFLVGYCLAKANRCTSSRVYFLFKKKNITHTRTHTLATQVVYFTRSTFQFIYLSLFFREKKFNISRNMCVAAIKFCMRQSKKKQ